MLDADADRAYLELRLISLSPKNRLIDVQFGAKRHHGVAKITAGRTRKNGILEGERHRLACLSANERIKPLSPDKLHDTLRLYHWGIT
jgi:hypothetical protein